MSDTPRPTRSTATTDDVADARLEDQLLHLVRGWLRRSREASAAHTEAAIDRASFESFPASDPVAPAAASSARQPALEEIDCTMRPGLLEFRCASDTPDPSRPPPAWTIEGDAPGGGALRLRVWVDDDAPQEAVPSTLELEPVHASIRASQPDRRSGDERRALSRSMPAGFDRRRSVRRAADAAGADAR